jgi:ABC-type transport system involved in multi-copper enzyme maturation permease subunit
MEMNRISNRPVFWVLILAGFILGLLPVLQTWPHGVTDDYYVFYPRNPYVSWMYLDITSTYHIYALIFPLLASLTYSDAYAEDYNTGLIKNILTKVEKKKYLMNRYITNFCFGGIMAVLPLLVNFLGLMTAFPLIENQYFFGMSPIGESSFWPNLFYDLPLLYVGLRLFFLFLLGGLLASLGLTLSTSVKNRYIVLIFPFLVFLGLDVLFPSIGLFQFSITTLFLWNFKANWGILLYLSIGIFGSYIWYYAAGVKNETV